MTDHRDRWPSKTIFIFAAIGSAVGLGNIWRFPFYAGKYGGGAFLLPYLILLFLFGIPLLILEFSLGQKMQQGAVGAMRRVRKSFSGIGLGAIMCSFFVACYYAVVMAWSLLYCFYSMNIAWGDDPSGFFFEQVLHASGTLDQLWMIPTNVLVALVVCWIFVYFCIWKGVKSVSVVVTVTMPLPVILLIILLIRAVTLPGAMDGLLYYIRPDYQALLDTEVWVAALTQIFFSLSLGIGVMIAYGSYEKKTSDIVKSAYIIGISDAAIAILSGLVVFCTLGYMADQSGEEIAKLASAGPSLAFIVFPKALSLIPGAAFFSFFFFLTLLLLGIDSLFSLVEAISTTLHDQWGFIRKEDLTLYVCVFGFLGGLIFTTTAGIYFLDISDHFVTIYGIVGVSLLQSLSIGWGYPAEGLREWINQVSSWNITKWWSFAIRIFAPICLILLLSTALYRDVLIPYGDFPDWAIIIMGWSVIAIMIFCGLLFSFLATKKQSVNPFHFDP